MELPFVTLDVFTTRPYKGNPLAVVTIPADVASEPTQEQKQAVAAEFNLSETVFIHEKHHVGETQDDDQKRIDIFMPDQELVFAGHPTIGAAVSLLGRGIKTLVTKAGPITLEQTGPRHVKVAIPHNVHLHQRRIRDLNLAADSVSPHADIREALLNATIVSVVKGMSFIPVELPSLDALSRANSISSGSLRAGDLLDESWRKSFLAPYYYVVTGNRPGKGADPECVEIRSRLILDSLEDPATGSAACCLSSYLSLVDESFREGTRRYEITQGVEMGRESNIVVEVTLSNGAIEQVALAGTAVQVMRGYVTV